jgi:hypothetical protein
MGMEPSFWGLNNSLIALEGDGNYSDLVHFIKTINLTMDGGLFEREIEVCFHDTLIDVTSFF